MATSDRTILVTGATGHQGGAVAHHLLKRGKFNVRTLVRDKHKHSAIALKRFSRGEASPTGAEPRVSRLRESPIIPEIRLVSSPIIH